MLKICDLAKLSEIIPVTYLARPLNVSRQALRSRIKKKSELKISESQKIMDFLNSYNLEFKPATTLQQKE